MKLYNSFTQETRLTYLYSQWCRDCGSTDSVELHHILGREKNNKEKSSRFNSVPLCHVCHESVGQNDETRKRYLQLTCKFQLGEEPILLEVDKIFLHKYKHFYLD